MRTSQKHFNDFDQIFTKDAPKSDKNNGENQMSVKITVQKLWGKD